MKIILVTPDLRIFAAIADRIQIEKISTDVILLPFVDEALRAVPEGVPCLIISDSYNRHEDNESKTSGVEKLAIDAKKKNPKCGIIIYAIDFWGINEKLFDTAILMTGKDSYEKLFKTIKLFINQNPLQAEEKYYYSYEYSTDPHVEVFRLNNKSGYDGANSRSESIPKNLAEFNTVEEAKANFVILCKGDSGGSVLNINLDKKYTSSHSNYYKHRLKIYKFPYSYGNKPVN